VICPIRVALGGLAPGGPVDGRAIGGTVLGVGGLVSMNIRSIRIPGRKPCEIGPTDLV
jgi:hypothetical protein